MRDPRVSFLDLPTCTSVLHANMVLFHEIQPGKLLLSIPVRSTAYKPNRTFGISKLS
jgi:hypothetical protein